LKRVLFTILIAAALVGMVFAPASTVMAAASATRSLPSSAAAGGNFDVDISPADYGAFGQVEETLPAGFSYVGCDDLSEAAVTVEGQVVKFTLLGETAFSYTVKASSTAGTYTFSGILKDVDKVSYDVGGDTQITVTSRPSGGGGGGGAPTYYTETNLFGVEKSYRIDSDGEILATIEATSEDSLLTMTIPKGTIALGKDGKRLKSLQTAVDESPPDPPEDCCIIGLAFDFGPEGATFDPGITFEYTYDPDDIPEGVAEEDLVIAYYDEEAGEWVELDCVVDTENNTITASVSHFTTFAIIGAVTPPEEEEVVPPEEEEVVPPEEEEVAPAPPPEEEEVVPEVPAPINWPLIGGIIAAVVVVALLIYFLVVRRRAY